MNGEPESDLDAAPPRWRRPLLHAAAVVAVVAVALVAMVILRGSYATYGPELVGPLAPRAPAWSRPCWRSQTRDGRRVDFTVRCARVRGTVLYHEDVDPDGDGDRHAVVVAGLHLVELKYPRGVGPLRLPGVGGTLEAVGPMPTGGGAIPTLVVARAG